VFKVLSSIINKEKNMAEKNQLKQKSGSFTPRGLPALNQGKTSSEMAATKRGGSDAGEMYKKPGKTGKGMASARSDESSSETGPIKGGDDNKKRYSGTPQPEQYSNACGPKKTRFIN
jgi:hypothetical protein